MAFIAFSPWRGYYFTSIAKPRLLIIPAISRYRTVPIAKVNYRSSRFILMILSEIFWLLRCCGMMKAAYHLGMINELYRDTRMNAGIIIDIKASVSHNFASIRAWLRCFNDFGVVWNGDIN